VVPLESIILLRGFRGTHSVLDLKGAFAPGFRPFQFTAVSARPGKPRCQLPIVFALPTGSCRSDGNFFFTGGGFVREFSYVGVG